MIRKIFKYTIRTVFGFFAFFWVIATWAALCPDESYHHCESGEEEMSNTTCILFAVGSIIAFCIVWYFTRDKRTEKAVKRLNTKVL